MTKNTIGDRLRAARERRGWTLKQLSEKTGDVLSFQRIGAYETGDRTPGPDEIQILAKALRMRAAYLMALDNIELDITLAEETMIRNWRKLPEGERMAISRDIDNKAMIYRDAISDQEAARRIQISDERRSTKVPTKRRKVGNPTG